jgi:hypothetical protein
VSATEPLCIVCGNTATPLTCETCGDPVCAPCAVDVPREPTCRPCAERCHGVDGLPCDAVATEFGIPGGQACLSCYEHREKRAKQRRQELDAIARYDAWHARHKGEAP